MSKFRMTVSHLLALGGFTALSGASLAIYQYSLLGNNPADCRPLICNTNEAFLEGKLSQLYGNKEIYPNGKVYWDKNWDLRDSSNTTDVNEKNNNITTNKIDTSKEKPVVTATRHIILIRHGQYVQQKGDKILTALGRQQALATGDRLKSLNINFDKIIISTMTRAKETGGIISDVLPADIPKEFCSLIREGAPYPPEPSLKRLEPERWQFYEDNPRIEAAFRKYIRRADPQQSKDSYELIICHANVIRYFVCRALQFPPEGWLRMSIGNCGITWLTIRPNGRVSLVGLGDTGHLPPDLLTFN